ncbi:MAG: hypothetical protein M3O22_03135 [Pseudomonadota bacterium]|nr:hypothetical protein [Pseudomonadota bacterium]
MKPDTVPETRKLVVQILESGQLVGNTGSGGHETDYQVIVKQNSKGETTLYGKKELMEAVLVELVRTEQHQDVTIDRNLQGIDGTGCVITVPGKQWTSVRENLVKKDIFQDNNLEGAMAGIQVPPVEFSFDGDRVKISGSSFSLFLIAKSAGDEFKKALEQGGRKPMDAVLEGTVSVSAEALQDMARNLQKQGMISSVACEALCNGGRSLTKAVQLERLGITL